MDLTTAVGILCLWATLSLHTVDGSSHICDFETPDNTCGYVQDSTDDFDWSVTRGNTPTSETGPSHDHTLGVNSTDGHYMYIETSAPRAWDAARIISPTFQPTPAFCVRFFYHMHGKDTGRLTVLLRRQGEVVMESLWTLKGEQGDEWIGAEVDGSSASGFEILFEAHRGDGFKSDIAIDDITVTSETTCSGIAVTTQPETSPPSTPTENTSSPETSKKTPASLTRSWESSTKNFESPSKSSPLPLSTKSLEFHTATGSSPTIETQSEEVVLLEPIDSQLIIVILAAGLTFWGVVFLIITVVIYKSSQSQRHKGEVTYNVIGYPANQELEVITIAPADDPMHCGDTLPEENLGF
ncbi:uncharacterized protein [Asterias amurensis]|uniref:uncharacterized protein isoform X2 n=1 Tax=Asterias amurensis TaxID=7602 RepID=UPI003AB54D93